MLDSSIFLESSGGSGGGGGGLASDGLAVELRNEGGGGGEEGDRNSSGKRWPRQETEALLKLRSDMDKAFRDSILKAPLWEEVSRKLGELGYHRNAKKCKEKFENVYKYHKRTKEGRSGRQNGKNYRFFNQLENFDTQISIPSTPLDQLEKPTNSCQELTIPCSSTQDRNIEFMSASSSSGEESGDSVKKKRKSSAYFEGFVKDVLEKQEDLHNKFLDTVERYEKDRIAREETWKVQEMARIKKEREVLARERAISESKDAAVLAFLQKISQQQGPLEMPENLNSIFGKNPMNVFGETSTHAENYENSGGENSIQTGSSRWPKPEVEALINLKTDLDLKYQDDGPKGPLWEEVSSCMKKLGYDRNAKKCKEKWENINKYYKRVKGSNKRRPGDSKTCPYFSLLDSLHEKKSKKSKNASDSGGYNLEPVHILMQMMGQQQSMGEYLGQNQDEHGEDEHNIDSGDSYQIVADHPSISG